MDQYTSLTILGLGFMALLGWILYLASKLR
jgi:hypothetical protein